MSRIFLSPPHMGGNELALIEEAFGSNYIAPVGPTVDRFEKAFAEYTGIPHTLALSSGTAAIHLALRLVGVGAGDRVLVPSLTFIGGVAPVLYQGATPIFIDCDKDSWTMDTNLLAETLEKYAAEGTLPKAVVPADIYGQSCDLDKIIAICAPYGVAVITDSAEAVGTRYNGRHAGNGALMAAFSFNGNKIITTSGGGMLASHDEAFIAKARHLSQQARDGGAHYEHSTYGYNYRMSNIVAAIGCGQLEVLDARVARRREIFAYYKQALSGLPGIGFMPEAVYGRSTHWLSVITVNSAAFGASSEDIRLALEAANIESRPLWKPMHMQPVFAGSQMVGGTVCEQLFAKGLCLPSGTQMSDDDLARITGIIAAQYKA